MNSSIVRLYVLVLALFITVVGFTSYWAIFDADELRGRSDNRRSLIEAQKIPRGTITTVDGTEVAVSVPRGSGNQRIFVREYPQGELFGHPVGYSFIEFGSTEIERSENDILIGRDNEFVSILEQLEGQVDEGSDLTVTLDAEAQQIAQDGIENALSIPGTGGALVAIEPDTGAVRAMVSEPGYDPNLVPDDFKELNKDEENDPLVNRPTQSVYPPGSTMKVVTATAALDSGEFETSTTLNAASGIEISGVPLANSGGQDFGTIDMTEALTNSVNTYWAQVGEQLGTETMVEYMERFGFYSRPSARLPLRRAGAERADQLRRRARSGGLRRRPRRDRPGRRRGPGPDDPTPDGDGRVGGRQRRHADGADVHPGGDRPRRTHDRGARPGRVSRR